MQLNEHMGSFIDTLGSTTKNALAFMFYFIEFYRGWIVGLRQAFDLHVGHSCFSGSLLEPAGMLISTTTYGCLIFFFSQLLYFGYIFSDYCM